MNKEELTHKIQQYSASIGFDLFGVTNPTNNLKNYSKLLSWLNNGYHASMHWIENRKDERKNIDFSQYESIFKFAQKRCK